MVVCSSRRAVASELRLLAKLKVFPSAELAAIRREYKVLDRERTALLRREERRRGRRVGRHASARHSSARPRRRRRCGIDKNGGGADRSSSSGDSSVDDDFTSDEGEGKLVSKWRSEGELELEFCERKLAILRQRRKQADQQVSIQARGFVVVKCLAVSLATDNSSMFFSPIRIFRAAHKARSDAAFDEQDFSDFRPRGGTSAMRLHAARAFSRENY